MTEEIDSIRLAEDVAKMKRWAEEVKRQERIARVIKSLGRTTKAERRFIEETFGSPNERTPQ